MRLCLFCLQSDLLHVCYTVHPLKGHNLNLLITAALAEVIICVLLSQQI